MFTKWKFRRICRQCKGPDYIDRIPALAYLGEYRRKRKARLIRNAALCICVAVAVLAASVFIVFGGVKTSEKAAKQPQSEVLYSDVKNYNGYSWARVNAGNVICDRRLAYELGKEENADSLFAVVVVLYNHDELEAVTETRVEILTGYTFFLKAFHEKVKAVLSGEGNVQDVIDDIVYRKYTYELSEYEAVGGFDTDCFDKATIDTVYKVLASTEAQLGDRAYLKQLDSELDYVFRDSGITETKITMWDICFNKSYFADVEWQYENDISYFEALGLELTPLNMEEALTIGSQPQKIYKAIIKKSQVELIKGTKYGIYMELQSKATV